jgi:predicted DNA-binding antitoxin AbrB/MazE fold protein
MKKSVEAIYENGVFRPLEPVDLPEHQRVQLTVADEDEWLDRDYIEWAASQVQESVSLEAVRQALAKIPGSLTADFIAEREETCDPRA